MLPPRSKMVLESIRPSFFLKGGYFTLTFQVYYDASRPADLALEPNVPSGTLSMQVSAAQVSQFVQGQSYYCDLTPVIIPPIQASNPEQK